MGSRPHNLRDLVADPHYPFSQTQSPASLFTQAPATLNCSALEPEPLQCLRSCCSCLESPPHSQVHLSHLSHLFREAFPVPTPKVVIHLKLPCLKHTVRNSARLVCLSEKTSTVHWAHLRARRNCLSLSLDSDFGLSWMHSYPQTHIALDTGPSPSGPPAGRCVREQVCQRAPREMFLLPFKGTCTSLTADSTKGTCIHTLHTRARHRAPCH